ncbi:hypothetical protein FH972_004501 [Carpinus fangiana]|uniref:Uncharacterized protein n=1 Tax=Carpinus fangiana TaxID=176857 RepID=A0A5N6QL99_9ROSI|nr:hypothetical protein FH972_004501 [Carpinus fangiana]
MRRSSSYLGPSLSIPTQNSSSSCTGLLHLADAVELFVQVSDALVLDPPLPSIDLEEAPPVFGGGRGRVCFVWVWKRKGHREREREREGERDNSGEREGESDFIHIIPAGCSPDNDGIPGFVWV